MKQFLLFFIIMSVGCAFAAEVSDASFSQAIRQIKQTYSIKSLRRELTTLKTTVDSYDAHLNPTNSLKSDFVKALVSNQHIGHYINRPAHSVIFTDQYVPIINNKYEKSLYTVLGNYASYRGGIESNSFFEQFSGQGRGINEYTSVALNELIAKGESRAKNKVEIHVNCGGIKELRQRVDECASKVTADYYQVSRHCEGGHAIVAVVKYSCAHEPITFLVNGWVSPGYHKSLASRFNEGSYVNRLFLDASFDLQKIHDGSFADYNCFLYALEFAKAATQYLQHTDLTELHNACVAHNFEQATSLVHNGLTHFLPYYDCSNGSCTQVSRDLIRKHHRDLRWTISGYALTHFLQGMTVQSNASR